MKAHRLGTLEVIINCARIIVYLILDIENDGALSSSWCHVQKKTLGRAAGRSVRGRSFGPPFAPEYLTVNDIHIRVYRLRGRDSPSLILHLRPRHSIRWPLESLPYTDFLACGPSGLSKLSIRLSSTRVARIIYPRPSASGYRTTLDGQNRTQWHLVHR
jgi:hypothetical protein